MGREVDIGLVELMKKFLVKYVATVAERIACSIHMPQTRDCDSEGSISFVPTFSPKATKIALW